MISQLALEASARDQRICDLAKDLLQAVTEKELFDKVLGVQSRSEVEWIVPESARLVCPDFADVLIGRQAL
jgi:hypothetical protein